MTSKKIDVNIPYKVYNNSYCLKGDNQEGHNKDSIEIDPIFYFAIENYDTKILKFLISNDNIDFNCPFIYKSKPCTFEIDDVYNDKDEKYKKPKEEEIDNLVTPLELATSMNDLNILTLLFENDKIDVNKKSNRTVVKIEQKKTSTQIYSPIYITYKNNYIEILKLFLANEKLENDAEYIVIIDKESDGIKNKSCIGSSLLFWAFITNKNEFFDLFMESGKFDINTKSKINKININNNLRTIDIIENEFSLLSKTIQDNNIDKFQILLSYENIDPNAISSEVEKNLKFEDYDSLKNYLVSQEITSKNHVESFSLTKEEASLLHQAVRLDRIEMIEILLSNDKIDANIHDIKINQKFDKNKIDQNIETKTKMTPLFYAIQFNNIEIVKILLSSNNVDVNCHSFLSNYHKLAVDDIDKENDNLECFGFTPFNFAEKLSRTEIIKLFLSLKDEKNINTD